MKYIITHHGINEIKRFNELISGLQGFMETDSINNVNSCIDAEQLLIKELDNIIGTLDRPSLFKEYNEALAEFDTVQLIYDYDPDTWERMVPDLLNQNWLKRVDEDSYSPWLEIITNNIHQGSNLISSIVEVIQGIKRDEVELILDEIETSELFSKTEERAIISTIEFLYHGDRIDCLTSITQKLIQTYQK